MTDITNIVEAIATVLTAAIPAIDANSKDDFLPAVDTDDTALVLPVFGQESEYGTYNLTDTANYQSHRLRAELWVKHLGDVGDTTTRTRERIAQAVKALRDSDDLGLGAGVTVATFDGRTFDVRIEASVAADPVDIGGVPFIVITLIVPVTKFD